MKKKTPSESKVFVMTRPPEGGDYLVIQTAQQAQKSEQLDELYNICFYDYFLNLSNILTVRQHKILLSTLTAPLAYQFFMHDASKCKAIISHALNDKAKGNKVYLQTLQNMPDEITQLDYIIRYNLSVFFNDIKTKGLEKALVSHHMFYSDLEGIFFLLPACFCFGIIEAVAQISPKLGKK